MDTSTNAIPRRIRTHPSLTSRWRTGTLAIVFAFTVINATFAKSLTPLLVPTHSPVALATAEQIRKNLEQAGTQTKEQNWNYVVDLTSQALRLDSSNASALLSRAQALAKLNKLTEAISDYLAATKLVPYNAEAFGNLGRLLVHTQRFAEARAASKRATKLNPNISDWLITLGHTHLLQGEAATARKYYRQALPLIANDKEFQQGPMSDLDHFIEKGWSVEACRREQAWLISQYPHYLPHRTSLDQVQHALEALQRNEYERALQQAEAVLKTQKVLFGKQSPQSTKAIWIAAESHKNLKHYSAAESRYQQVLAFTEKSLGSAQPDATESLIHLAELYRSQGRYAEAEPLLTRALVIREQVLGKEHVEIAKILDSLGGIYRSQGRYAEAEAEVQRALRIIETVLGPQHSDMATSFTSLALIYYDEGHYAEAELCYRRALTIRENIIGSEHPETATSLNNLAVLYRTQGRYSEAEQYGVRALTINEKSFGRDHPNTATILNTVAEIYRDQGRADEAETNFKRALDIREKTLSPEHPLTAYVLKNLAGLYRDQHRYAEAESNLERSFRIHEKSLGSDHPHTATSIINLASLYQAQDRPTEAESLFRRSLATFEKTLGPKHPDTAFNLNKLAELLRDQGHTMEALLLARRATDVFRTRVDEAADKSTSTRMQELKDGQRSFRLHLALLAEVGTPSSKIERLKFDAEAYEVSQLAQSSDTSLALQQASALNSGDSRLEALIRTVQTTEAQARAADQGLPRLLAHKDVPAQAKENARQNSERLEIARKKAFVALKHTYPAIADLLRPDAAKASYTQKLLADDEALVSYLVDEQSTYAFVLTKTALIFESLPVTRAALDTLHGKIYCQMPERQGTSESAPKKCSDKLEPYHDLFETIFAPLAAHLTGVKRLVVIPDGPLQSLPFGMLLEKLPPDTLEGDDAFREAPWLIKRYPITVLPSVYALKVTRTLMKSAQRAPEPFIGFGDPVLTGTSQSDIALATRDGGDVDALRKLPPLPNTGSELRNIASRLKAPLDLARTQARATEPQVTSLPLDQYRVVAFSTHGLLAEEAKRFGGPNEPALVLTPPAETLPNDNGLLSMSEVAALTLNAEWTVLSACNSAGPDSPRAEALSGLARAFIVAGSRALLVSHWSVNSKATEQLITDMFTTLTDHPDLGRAEALQRAMRKMIADPTGKLTRPRYWAPFVVVGEGAVH